MKKLGKSTKKGFTLVELIVVLVILAVLAAMLVPALVGYIDRARAEKEYQTAATVYGAAQAVITEKYAKNEFTTDETSSIKTNAKLKSMGDVDAVIALAGVDSKAVTAYEFNFNTTTHVITGGSVTISGYKYSLTIDENNGAPSWSAAKAGTTTQQQPAQGGQGN